MNRISNAISRMEAKVADRIKQGITTPEAVEGLRKALDMNLEEYAAFQNAKSLAVAQGVLTLEEGQTVYAMLGNTPDVFNDQPIHVKSVLTGLFAELLKARMAG